MTTEFDHSCDIAKWFDRQEDHASCAHLRVCEVPHFLLMQGYKSKQNLLKSA